MPKETTFEEREARRRQFRPLPDALVFAKQYLQEKLGDRRGFRHLLDQIELEDPNTYRAIVRELAVEMEMFARDLRTMR